MTERDLLKAIGAGLDPDTERTGAHLTWDVVYASPGWTLEEAALAMARGGFRHLVVLDDGEVLGVISVRDIMRVWAREKALKNLLTVRTEPVDFCGRRARDGPSYRLFFTGLSPGGNGRGEDHVPARKLSP